MITSIQLPKQGQIKTILILILQICAITCFLSSPSRIKLTSNKKKLKLFTFTETKPSAIQESIKTISPQLQTPTRKLSKLEREFKQMVDDFQNFSSYDIACIQNKRYRILFEGVASAVIEPPVYRAFVVLFEDYVPVRIAGRMIYRHLKSVMEKSQLQVQRETKDILESTTLKNDEIQGGRLMFLALKDVTSSKDLLTMDELVQLGIVETIMEICEYDKYEQFIKDVDSEALDFRRFMIGLQKCSQKNMDCDTDTSCDVKTVLEDLNERMKPLVQQRQSLSLDERKIKYNKKYDEMVSTFQTWEDFIPQNSGRNYDILRGCIVGSKNDKVVDALRIVYLDYSALRIAGDLIYRLATVLIKKRKKN